MDINDNDLKISILDEEVTQTLGDSDIGVRSCDKLDDARGRSR